MSGSIDFGAALQGVSIIIAALTAIWGVHAWQREFVGKKRIELAEEVLAGFYEARDVIKWIRSSASVFGEGGTREPAENETPHQKEVRDRAYIVFERYNQHRELFNRLRALRYRFIAQYGPDAAKPFDGLDKVRTEIFASAHALAYLWERQGMEHWRTEKAREDHLKRLAKHEAIFWEGFADKDPITPLIEKAVDDTEKICREIIDQETVVSKIRDRITRQFKKKKR